jgi:eukaryotic-like serine/threonine-protein kinase
MFELPGYKITKTLGEGGMATVYLGEQLSLQRSVAIKVLSATLCSEPAVQAQFKQESRLVASLNHPNIIQVIDQGLIGLVQPYFVMQYVKSIPLSLVLKREDVSPSRKMDIVIQVCKALSYAHRNGVVHRDIKPANVLVDYDGHVRVVDFGIAGYFSHANTDDDTHAGANSRQKVIMGTPAYMAPEQHDPNSEVTALSDIYALGILIHELFTGSRPVKGEVKLTVVSPELQELVTRCLSTELDKRPQSVDEIIRSLLLLFQGKHLQDNAVSDQERQNDIPSRYVLMDVLKQNEFGATYLVNEPTKKQWLVVKKQKIKYAGHAYRASNKLSKGSHPHIVNIHGTSKNERVFISVMEYVQGGSLKDRISQAFSLARWLVLAQQLCDGLHYAHSMGVVHGNLRPSNLLMVSPGHLKITDFGFNDHSAGEVEDWYQPVAEDKSIAADIFSAGAVLFHLLTGKTVKQSKGRITNLKAMKKLPAPIQKIVNRMLMVDSTERYRSIEQVRIQLGRYIDFAKKLKVKPKARKKAPPVVEAPTYRPWYSFVIRLLIVVGLVAEVIIHF